MINKQRKNLNYLLKSNHIYTLSRLWNKASRVRRLNIRPDLLTTKSGNLVIASMQKTIGMHSERKVLQNFHQ